MKELSIIIPCYNAEKYIIRCLKSIEEQKHNNIEVIIINDCSTDMTLDEVNKNRDCFSFDLKIINNLKNIGPGLSRNKGIELANSKFITFCDADDWYEKEYFDNMLSLLNKNDADIAFCGYNVVTEGRKIEHRTIKAKDGKIELNNALGMDCDSLCMMFVKTDIMKNTLLPNLRNCEDVAVVPVLLINSKVITVTTKCFYNYYRRTDSSSQQSNMKVVEDILLSYEYVKEKIPKSYKLELEFLGIKNMLYNSIITLFSFSYDTKMADEILYQFSKEFPEWYKNKYIKNLAKYKKIVLKLLQYRMYFVIKIIAEYRNYVTKRND